MRTTIVAALAALAVTGTATAAPDAVSSRVVAIVPGVPLVGGNGSSSGSEGSGGKDAPSAARDCTSAAGANRPHRMRRQGDAGLQARGERPGERRGAGEQGREHGRPHMRHGRPHMRTMLELRCRALEQLGVDPQTLREARKEGQRPMELLHEAGVTPEKMHEAMLAALDAMVRDGRIEAAQAERIRKRIERRAERRSHCHEQTTWKADGDQLAS